MQGGGWYPLPFAWVLPPHFFISAAQLNDSPISPRRHSILALKSHTALQAIQIKVDYTYSYLRRGTASYEFVLYGDKLAQKKLEEEGADEESKKDKFTKDPAECKAQWEQEFKEMEEAERKEKERVQLLNNAIADFKTILTFDPNDIEAYNHRCKVVGGELDGTNSRQSS